MYSGGGGGGGGGGRIYNPRPDPLERGPPKRVLRDETHIGEMVAASKKRISWRFTLGEADTVHEVVLTHSIMSYKKLVEYDGRQMHFSSTATPGDWHYTMVLDGLNNVLEVRINDMEGGDIPKYDFLIDRVPFRRWDVYRRKKQPVSTNTYNAQPNAQSSNAYGQTRWGPAGAVPPEQTTNRGSLTGNTDRSRGFSSSSGSRGRSASGNQQWGATSTTNGNRAPYQSGRQQQPAQYHERSSLPERPTPAASGGVSPPPAPNTRASMRRQQQQQPKAEINLIDDFGPSVSVSVQSLLFDPLAGPTTGPPNTAGNTSGQQQAQQPGPAPVQSLATGAPLQTPYVDPFASVASAGPLKPTSAPMNLDPFASQSKPFVPLQQQQARPMMAAGNPMAFGQQQQQPTSFNAPQQQQQQQYQQQQQFQQRASLTGGYPSAAGMGQANYNISQLMNPVALNSKAPGTNQGSKSINIDPFAGLGR